MNSVILFIMDTRNVFDSLPIDAWGTSDTAKAIIHALGTQTIRITLSSAVSTPQTTEKVDGREKEKIRGIFLR